MLRLAFALAAVVALPSSAQACAAASEVYSALVGFDADSSGFWLVEGEVSRDMYGSSLGGRLDLIHRSREGDQLERRPLSIPERRQKGHLEMPASSGLVELARRELPDLAPGATPKERGIRVGDDLRSLDGLACQRSVPAQWAIDVRAKGRLRRVFRLPEHMVWTVRPYARPRFFVSPDGSFLVATLVVSHSMSFHHDQAAYSRIVELVPACLDGTSKVGCLDLLDPLFEAPELACSSFNGECTPKLGEWACAEGLSCVAGPSGPVCGKCRADAECRRDGRRFCAPWEGGARECVDCRSDADCSSAKGERCSRGHCGH